MIERWKTLLGAFAMASTPFLMGAESKSCSSGPDVAVGGDAASFCVSTAGGPCGGNVRSPCACAPGLDCRAAAGGPPVGDVGGTCQASVDSDAAATSTDAGDCAGQQGDRCGGNTTHPCSCAAELVCTPADGGPPFGDVGGTCERPAVRSDAGCVQNVLCIQGDVFDRTLCRCVPQNDAGVACQSASDCHGILPQVCVACAGPDGGRLVRCAHWVCLAGQCETAICD